MKIAYIRPITRTEISDGTIAKHMKKVNSLYNDAQIHQENFNWNEKPGKHIILQDLINGLNQDDTLIIAGLERLSCDMDEALQIIHELTSKGVNVHTLEGVKINKDNATDIINTIQLTLKSRELMFKESRSLSAIESKKKSTVKQGKPKSLSNEDKEKVVELLKTNSQEKTAQILGISRSTISRFIREFKKNN